jgi:hypothetical protein
VLLAHEYMPATVTLMDILTCQAGRAMRRISLFLRVLGFCCQQYALRNESCTGRQPGIMCQTGTVPSTVTVMRYS